MLKGLAQWPATALSLDEGRRKSEETERGDECRRTASSISGSYSIVHTHTHKHTQHTHTYPQSPSKQGSINPFTDYIEDSFNSILFE